MTSSGSGSGSVQYVQQYATRGAELENQRPRLETCSSLTTASTLPTYWMRHDHGPYMEADAWMHLPSAPVSRFPVSRAPSQAQSRWHQERNRYDHVKLVLCLLLHECCSDACIFGTVVVHILYLCLLWLQLWS